MTASLLVKMLKLKHAEDVFVPECKDGPTWSSKHSRLDAWAMQKSWTHPTTFGYECKISRSDFQNDDKWQNYLELCSDFYFVCPWGLIEPDEVAAPAGLLWASKTGERLWLKKKAARRAEVQIPETMWRYLLMRFDTKKYLTTAEEWASWLARTKDEFDIGHKCSRKIRELVAKRIDTVECENRKLAAENKLLAEVQAWCTENKVNLHAWNLKDSLSEKKKRAAELFDENFLHDLRSVKQRIDELLVHANGVKP